MSLAAAGPAPSDRSPRSFPRVDGWLPYAVAVLGAVVITRKATSGAADGADVLLDAVTGGTYIAAGVILARSDAAAMARLLWLTAAAWFAADLMFFYDVSPAEILGGVCADAYDAMLAVLVLAFPRGRLEGRRDRLLVALAFIATIGLAAVRQVIDPPHDVWGGVPFLHVTDAGVTIRAIQDALEVAVAVVIVGTLARRPRAIRPFQRSTILRRLAFAAAGVIAVQAALELLDLVVPHPSPGGIAHALMAAHPLFSAMQKVAGWAIPIAVAAGEFSLATTRLRIAELGLRHPTPDALGGQLRTLLGDESVEIVPGDGPTGLGVTPVCDVDGRPLGRLMHAGAFVDEPELLRAACDAAASALAADQLRARVEPVQVARDRTTVFDELSERQRQVLDLVADGHSNATIARRLGVGEKAIEKHLRNIYDVLDLPPHLRVNRRVGAAVLYLDAQRDTTDAPS